MSFLTLSPPLPAFSLLSHSSQQQSYSYDCVDPRIMASTSLESGLHLHSLFLHFYPPSPTTPVIILRAFSQICHGRQTFITSHTLLSLPRMSFLPCMPLVHTGHHLNLSCYLLQHLIPDSQNYPYALLFLISTLHLQ